MSSRLQLHITDTFDDTPYEQRLFSAVVAYLGRNRGQVLPVGRRDGKGNWLPHETLEARTCCRGIKQPYPGRQTLLRHCRSARHVSVLYGVERTDLLRKAGEVQI